MFTLFTILVLPPYLFSYLLWRENQLIKRGIKKYMKDIMFNFNEIAEEFDKK